MGVNEFSAGMGPPPPRVTEASAGSITRPGEMPRSKENGASTGPALCGPSGPSDAEKPPVVSSRVALTEAEKEKKVPKAGMPLTMRLRTSSWDSA